MKKLNIIKKMIIVLIILLLLNLTVFLKPTFADVGSFESYSSDYGGSDYGSSWDWGSSSSSWDDDYSYGSGGLIIGGFGGFGGFIFMVIVIIIIIASSKNKGQQRPKQRVNPYTPNYRPEVPQQNEAQILGKLKQIDPNFNQEEFLAWTKTLFVKLQQAWTARDWEVIRAFETKELFEQHKAQLQGYIDNHTINVMDRICVNYARLYQFRQEGDRDILIVELNSRMKDYIIDEKTGNVVQGDKVTERTNTYLLTFVRTKGRTTQSVAGDIVTTNCPNCGAPTKITSSGKCEYCGSVITTDDHDWALSNLQRK